MGKVLRKNNAMTNEKLAQETTSNEAIMKKDRGLASV